MPEKDIDLDSLVTRIAKIGKKHKMENVPPIYDVEPFQHFFRNGDIDYQQMNSRDGGLTRREVIARYLLLSAVLDQGPDIKGVRDLLKAVVTDLYRREIRILHRPKDFFEYLNISIDNILEKHESIKEIRAKDWAKDNNANPNKYNLFFAQSQRGIISINQVLDYAVHRWGVPLCMYLLLEKDNPEQKEEGEVLIPYLESFDSAEIMARQIKENERYGLGSAIGYKAAHLFAKWYVDTFRLSKRKDDGWTAWSYEVPFDSNAGRVLFRSGFLLALADISDYKEREVIQEHKGKGGKHYIRVTKIRGMRAKNVPKHIRENYIKIVKDYMKILKRSPRNVEIQRVPNAVLLNTEYSVGDFDDGLMYIGTNFCFNHDAPDCEKCPIRNICLAQQEENLITNYRT